MKIELTEIQKLIKESGVKVGNVYASDNTSCEIIEVNKEQGYLIEKCLRGPGKDQISKKMGGQLSFFLFWLNSKTVRKVE